jgi:hypothetical protein
VKYSIKKLNNIESEIYINVKKSFIDELGLKKINNLKKENNANQLIIENLKNSISNYEKSNKLNANLELESKIKYLEEKNNELTNQLKMLLEDLASNQTRISEMEQSLEESVITCNQSEELVKQLHEQNDLLKEEVSLSIATYNKLNIENRSLKEKNEDLLKKVEINNLISNKLQNEIKKNKQYDIIFYNHLPIISLAVSLITYYFFNSAS